MSSVTSKLLLLFCANAALVGCGVPGIPKPPSLDLPLPVSDLHAVRKGDSVYLAWTQPTENTDHLAVRHLGVTRICRSVSTPMSDCAKPVGEVPAAQLVPAALQKTKLQPSAARIQGNYTDHLQPALLAENPAAQIFYSISALNERGRSAGLSNVVSVPAAAALAPPSDFAAQVAAEGIVLNWKATTPPETARQQWLYRIYRRADGASLDAVVGEVPLEASSPTQLVDHSFDWEKTYSYRATVVTLVREAGVAEIRFEGNDTPSIKVFAHDIFPPAVPSGLQAAFSGTGQQPFIDLIWAPDTDADLAGYNVFRREESGQAVKINQDLVKAPAFRDTNIAGGKKYFYSVSATDVRANESVPSQEASEAVP